MNTKATVGGILIGTVALAGPAHAQPGRHGRHHQQQEDGQPDYFRNRRMLTGSHIPQRVDRPFYSQLSSYVPLESFSRERPSLVSGEQVVGAGRQSLYRLNEPSTGASPAGSAPLPGRN